jgi:hypothetical protein
MDPILKTGQGDTERSYADDSDDGRGPMLGWVILWLLGLLLVGLIAWRVTQ